jgi:hypothetical protein
MSTFHFILLKTVVAIVAPIAICILIVVVRRLTENPDRKQARKLLYQAEQLQFHIYEIQHCGLGDPAQYDQANLLDLQAREPVENAKAALKERRYVEAREHAAEAFRLRKAAVDVQSPGED